MLEINEYVEKNRDHFSTLYYPGAYMDLSPLEIFWMSIPDSPVRNIIYSDYVMENPSTHWTHVEVEVGTMIHGVSAGRGVSMGVVTPGSYGVAGWAHFWSPHPGSTSVRSHGAAWGSQFKAGDHAFTYLATEGIGTYSVLLANGIRPDVLVLQDHGMGLNWARIGGGPGDLLYDMLVRLNGLPRYLLVQPPPDGITTIYPGYRQVTKIFKPVVHRSMHPGQDHRALFMLED